MKSPPVHDASLLRGADRVSILDRTLIFRRTLRENLYEAQYTMRDNELSASLSMALICHSMRKSLRVLPFVAACDGQSIRKPETNCYFCEW